MVAAHSTHGIVLVQELPKLFDICEGVQEMLDMMAQ